MTTNKKVSVLDMLDKMAGHLLKGLGLLFGLLLSVVIGVGVGVGAFVLVVAVSTLVGAAAGWLFSVVPFAANIIITGLALFGVQLEPNQLPLFCGILAFLSAFFSKGSNHFTPKPKTPEEKRQEAMDKLFKDISHNLGK